MLLFKKQKGFSGENTIGPKCGRFPNKLNLLLPVKDERIIEIFENVFLNSSTLEST